MIKLFWISLFSTLIIVRVFAHLFHDKIGYKKENGKVIENSRTLTAYLRRKIGFDLHHIHIGFIMLLIIIPWIIYSRLNHINLILFGIGISLVADQILPLLGFGNYFSKKMLIGSIILHVLIAVIGIIIL